MIPDWFVIGTVAFSVAALLNRFNKNLRWFNRLRRPQWLTFESAIPWIWITIFICGSLSAILAWRAEPDQSKAWILMGGYLILEVAIMAYTPIMCQLRSLKVGTAIGATGFLIGLVLTYFVFQVSTTAGSFLVPFLLWSPIGTYVTWAMIELNPREA